MWNTVERCVNLKKAGFCSYIAREERERLIRALVSFLFRDLRTGLKIVRKAKKKTQQWKFPLGAKIRQEL